MTKMRSTDKRKFPRLATFVAETLRRGHEDSNKLGLFLESSGLSPADARELLTNFATSPWIDIDPARLGADGLPAMGWFDPLFKGSIALAEDVAQRFEADLELPEAQEAVQSILLRELIRRARNFDDAQNGQDPGAAFELAAYGKRHHRWFGASPFGLRHADSSRFVFPVTGRIGGGTAFWGKNIRAGGSRSHQGIDIFNEIGTPVQAIADGVVLGGNRFREGNARRKEVGNYGQMVDIDHGNGFVSRYAHLDRVTARPGPVKQGQPIGSLGATGTQWGRWAFDGKPTPEPPPGATAPHLHFEILNANGNPFKNIDDTFDPASFFDFVGNGKNARNTPVTAGLKGRVLDQPVGPVAALPDSLFAEAGASPEDSQAPAFPNRSLTAQAPRGLRNNNPGNIKKSGTQWLGLRGAEQQLDPKFFQFEEVLAKYPLSLRERVGVRGSIRITF